MTKSAKPRRVRAALGWLAGVAALAASPGPSRAAEVVLLASTIGPVEAGIVPLLEERFEAETGIRVRHVGAGTGEALKLAEKGSFDLVLVHARALEERFVADGFGTERIPLMYNDFVIVGPAADPAGVRRAPGTAAALQAIARAQARFVSRGDRSGTHVAEVGLWDLAGLKPAGPWYQVYERGADGNAATLRHADREGAYTVIDRATWLSLRDGLKLVLLHEKDAALLNPITLVPVSPARFPRVNHAGAAAFVAWLTAPDKGQRIIESFGREKHGAPLFFPDSAAWRAAHPK
jgi:tungstate transport system substrate-binding protein